MATHATSVSAASVVQVRTHTIIGLPEQYRGVIIEVSGEKGSLRSTSFSRSASGIVACEFWARLAYPSHGDIVIKLVPLSPWARPRLSLAPRGRTLFGSFDIRADAADAAEASEGRGAEGHGGRWRSVVLQLRPRGLVDRIRAKNSTNQHYDVKLQMDYCVFAQPGPLAHLPELELLAPLARPLHSYAHGGFMGTALSLLADPHWSTLLMSILGEEDDKMQSHISELASLQQGGVTTARLEMLMLMLALENSPVLCAYGLVRSSCTKPPQEAAMTARSGAELIASPPYIWQHFGLPHTKVPYMLRHHSPVVGGPPALQPRAGSLGPAFNRYGYAPLGMEWDLWLSPDDPAALSLAVVDHGSAGDLVQQAIAMALRCDAVAKSMGRRHNRTHGISPMRWLVDFATALNQGVNNHATKPLPLWAAPPSAAPTAPLAPYTDGSACPTLESYLRLTAESLCVRLEPGHLERLPAARLLVRVRVVGNTHTHSKLWLKTFAETADPGDGAGGAPGNMERSAAAMTQPSRASGLPEAGGANAGTAAEAGAGAGAGAAQPAAAAAGGAKLYVCCDAAGAPGKPPKAQAADQVGPGGGGGGASGHGCFYPMESRDLHRSVVVVEVFNAKTSSIPVARAVLPLALLAGRPEGSLTFTAALHPRKGLDAAKAAAPQPAATGPGTPVAEALEGESREDPTAQAARGPTDRIGSSQPRAPPPRSGPGQPAAPVLDAGTHLDAKGSVPGGEPGEAPPGAPSAQSMNRSVAVVASRQRDGAGAPVTSALPPAASLKRGLIDIAAAKERRRLPRAGSGAWGGGGGGSRTSYHHDSALPTKPESVTVPEGPNFPQNRSFGGLGAVSRHRASTTVATETHGWARGGSHRFNVLGAMSLRIKLDDLGHVPAVYETDEDGAGGGGGSESSSDGDGEDQEVPLPEESEGEFEDEEEARPAPEVEEADLAVAAAAGGVHVAAPHVFASRDPGNAGAFRQQLAALGRSSVTVTLRWDRLSTLQAAQELHGLPAHIIQTCTAMLSAPGGLFLDVKSGYSRATDLHSFASTLAGIGIHVKAICSFVPKQIDFEDPHPAPALTPSQVDQQQQQDQHDSSAPPATNLDAAKAAAAAAETGIPGASPKAAEVTAMGSGKLPGPAPRTFDTVLFFHGLNGLELACEAGRVPPGTCVLFNGASMLLEDPGAAIVPPDDEDQPGPDGAATQASGGGLQGYNTGVQRKGAAGATAAATVTATQATEVTGGGGAAAEGSGGRDGAGGPAVKEAEIELTEAPVKTPRGGQVQNDGSGAGGGGAKGGGEGGFKLPVMVDQEAWRRYCTVVSIFKIYGGIYVQEPDCCPAAVDALIQLTNANPGYLPLGFAYGHLGNKAVAAAGLGGRGMAKQQLLEELSSRRALGRRVKKWIHAGVHVGANDQVYLSWGRRLLTSEELMYRPNQLLLLQLLADYDCDVALGVAEPKGAVVAEGAQLLHLLNGLGGFQFVFWRFHQHYEATSPFTLLEWGFNMNYTKALLRLLRNRGALAAMSPRDKQATARWLLRDPKLRLWWQRCFLRAGSHKHVKEALVALVESATEKEFEQICEALGGFHVLRRALLGWTRLLGWNYMARLKAAKTFWADGHADTSLIAASACTYGFVHYARRLPGGGLAPGQGLDEQPQGGGAEGGGAKAEKPSKRRLPREWIGPDGVIVTLDPRYSRDKSWPVKLWLSVRKASCCVVTCCTQWCMCHVCICCYPACMCPVLCYPYCRSRLLPFLFGVALVVLWWLAVAGVVSGTVGRKEGGK